MNGQYLPLTEYSTKYRVSISTLRRRIKADDINYRFEDGKYLILDGPMSTHQRVHRPSPVISEEALVGAHSGAVVRETAPLFGFNHTITRDPEPSQESSPAGRQEKAADDESVLLVANRLLTELKKAYSQILQEKEEQILHLHQELADLKTLARVLEAENEKLKNLRNS